MAICLYEHNQSAYRAAEAMLSKEGKAAVIHPTGTGKSFIGFKLCEDHPDKKICWLSPSRYIFATQLENLANASGGYQPENVEFITYARLMNMTDMEMQKVKPDYMILDEFHRCGALAWGQGVKRFLDLYEGVPLLGLSATAVRYLDNQRDMSDELFDGHIASTMTLGEAIVRGILHPPKYVQSVYSYRDDLEKYSERVCNIKDQKRREQAEDHLEKLKRALDRAEGLDVLFDRHMTERYGKYVVFCANYEAMQDAMGKVGEWFHLIDGEPHVYSLYTDDPAASKSFQRFKKDEDAGHLKLLFCIDALNEGVHVENVSGVILLRPTVSPIIYKQQIGRALSASRQTRPVIFDVVNNIENLYSIDAVQKEMEDALIFMKGNGAESEIANETFEVTGELKDCLRLFGAMEGMLAVSWDTMYLEAERYYEEHGDLLPVSSYETENGYALGRWIVTQRTNRRKKDPSMTGERIAALDKIGMDWDTARDRSWNTFYRAAAEYHEAHGDLDIPAGYVTESGVKLGRLYRGIRKRYAQGKLSKEQIAQLEGIGIEWDSVLVRKWMRYYGLVKEYYEKHGDLDIPYDYVADGLKVGIWISSQRESYGIGRLSKEQIRLLEGIGMSWDRFESKWERGFQYCQRYVDGYGDINRIPEDFQIDGFKPISWLRTQRYRKRIGKLSQERIERLESIGLKWDKNQAFWEKGYAHAMEYVKEHGSIRMPVGYVCEDGFKLKGWLNNQRTRMKGGKLSEEQVEKLRGIGVV